MSAYGRTSLVRIVITILVCLLGVWSYPARADIWDSSTFRDYSKAVEAYNRGNLKEARHLLESSIKDYPQNVLSHYLLARTLVRQGKDRKALKAFRNTLKLYPGLTEGWEAMGEVQERLGLWAEASDTYREMARRQPQNPEWPKRLAHIGLKMGDKKKTESYCKEWLRLDPRNEQAAIMLADVLSDQKRWEDAAAVLQKYYPSRGSIPMASRLATGYFNKGRYEKAKPWLQRLKRLQPQSSEHPYALGIITYHRGEKDKAEKFFKETLELEPEHFEANYNLGVIRMEQKNYEDAINLFERCTRIRPDASEPYLQLGRIYENVLLNPAKAKEYYKKAGKHP